MCQNEKKNQSTKINSELTHMLELLDKNMERVTITTFHIFKRLEKMFTMLNRDIKGTNKKIKLLEIKKL